MDSFSLWICQSFIRTASQSDLSYQIFLPPQSRWVLDDSLTTFSFLWLSPYFVTGISPVYLLYASFHPGVCFLENLN